MCPPGRIKGYPRPQRKKIARILSSGKRSETLLPKPPPDTLRQSFRDSRKDDVYAAVVLDYAAETVFVVG